MKWLNAVKDYNQDFIYVQSLLVSSCFYCLEFFADLGALGNYPGSPFLPSDSDILLESPDQQDIGNVKYIYILFLNVLNFKIIDE